MKEQVFPPSPNWYIGSAFACNSNGLLAYGSRNCLVVIDTNTGDNLPKVEIVANAHNDRITVVTFSPIQDKAVAFGTCVATAGDDGLVKVWDLKTMTPLIAHASHSKDSKVCGMDWSRLNPNLIVSIDDANTLVCWDLPSNSTHNLNVGKLSATTLACCPVDKHLVAIGCRTGLVCVVSIKGHGKVLFRMRGHDSEVLSLAWCPVSCNVIQQGAGRREPEQKECLLASSAKERSIFVWRAGTDGRYESIISIPPHLMADKRTGKTAVMEINWVSLCWPKPSTLLCSTRTGRILLWDLHLIKAPKPAALGGAGDAPYRQLWKTIHTVHNRMVFNLACPNINYEAVADLDGKLKEDENWRLKNLTDKEFLVWSTSQDRLVVCYDVNADKEVITIPTIGSVVYCIAASPIDPNRIAFAGGDSMIRVWNLSSPFPYDITTLWQKIRGKVTTIAWHPVQESKLAFGTAEGRVGVFDMLNPNKPPILMRPYHTKFLYTIGWGPAIFGGEEERQLDTEYVLYSCGEGAIIQYNIHEPENEARNLNELPQLVTSTKKGMLRTDLAWSPDNAILAIGNEDGTVQLVSHPKISVLSTIYAQKTLIQSLAWHPEGTATDTAYSPCQNWLAVAGKRSPIKVFNLNPVLEGDSSSQAECIAVFSLHKICVVDMCWSPHISGQLVSVSFDETAQVWDVLKQQPVGNFSSHVGPVHACCWSPVDPDFVITGGADSTLRVWKISALENTIPAEKKRERMKKQKAEQLQCTMSTKAASQQPEEDQQLDALLPVEGLSTREYDSHSYKRRGMRSYFPVWAKMWQGSHTNMLERCEKYTVEGHPPDTEASLLGSRNNVLHLLKEEEMNHIQNGNFEHVQHMALWKGNLAETLREAAQKKHLSDWLVSMAPMVSQRLWMEMCKAYAEQLTLEGNFHKAVSYLLACHKIEEALELFIQNNLYREAVTLAKLRLGEDDPTANNILRTWAHRQIQDGHFERSAECLLSIGDYSEGAEILGRRNDGKCLLVAALLARKAEDNDKALSLAKSALLQALLQKQWDVAGKIVAEFPELQPQTVVICIHKIVMGLLLEKIEVQGPLLEWVNMVYSSEYGKNPQEYYEALDQSLEKKLVPETKTKLWLAVSECLALSVSAPDERTKLWHLIQTANLCYQFQVIHPNIFPLLQLLVWLAPEGVLEKGSIFMREPEEEKAALLARSLKLYLYAGFFSWLANLETADVIDNKKSLSQVQVDKENDSGKNADVSEEVNGVKAETEVVLSNAEKSHPSVENSEEVNGVKAETEVVLSNAEESHPSLENSEEVTAGVNKVNGEKDESEPAPHAAKGQLKSTDSKTEAGSSVKTKSILEGQMNDNDIRFHEVILPLLSSYSNEIDCFAPVVEYFKIQVELKKCENEVASRIAHTHQSSAENSQKEQPTDHLGEEEKEEETSTLKGLQKLDELKEKKEEFEKLRGSAPNPFITYCNFRSICDYFANEKQNANIQEIAETTSKKWLFTMGTL